MIRGDVSHLQPRARLEWNFLVENSAELKVQVSFVELTQWELKDDSFGRLCPITSRRQFYLKFPTVLVLVKCVLSRFAMTLLFSTREERK